jgi:hypothetical protein
MENEKQIIVTQDGFDCPDCGDRHSGEDLAYICVGCPCETRPPSPLPAEGEAVMPDEREQGTKCQRCLKHYKVDVIVPDELWRRISHGINLMCAPCIATLIEHVSDFDAFQLSESLCPPASPGAVTDGLLPCPFEMPLHFEGGYLCEASGRRILIMYDWDTLLPDDLQDKSFSASFITERENFILKALNTRAPAAGEAEALRERIAKLEGLLSGDPHLNATPEERNIWRHTAVKYADKVEAENRRLVALTERWKSELKEIYGLHYVATPISTAFQEWFEREFPEAQEEA